MHGARGLLPEPPGSANACGKCGTVSLSLQVQYLPVAQQKRAAARTKLRPFVQGPCIHNIKLGSLSSTISHVPASSKANAARGDPSNPGDRVKTPRSAVAREAQPLKQSASEHPSVHKGCDPDALPAADPSAGAATPYTAASKQPSQSSQSVQSAQQAQPKQQAETSTSYRKPTSVATEKEESQNNTAAKSKRSDNAVFEWYSGQPISDTQPYYAAEKKCLDLLVTVVNDVYPSFARAMNATRPAASLVWPSPLPPAERVILDPQKPSSKSTAGDKPEEAADSGPDIWPKEKHDVAGDEATRLQTEVRQQVGDLEQSTDQEQQPTQQQHVHNEGGQQQERQQYQQPDVQRGLAGKALLGDTMPEPQLAPAPENAIPTTSAPISDSDSLRSRKRAQRSSSSRSSNSSSEATFPPEVPQPAERTASHELLLKVNCDDSPDVNTDAKHIAAESRAVQLREHQPPSEEASSPADGEDGSRSTAPSPVPTPDDLWDEYAVQQLKESESEVKPRHALVKKNRRQRRRTLKAKHVCDSQLAKQWQAELPQQQLRRPDAHWSHMTATDSATDSDRKNRTPTTRDIKMAWNPGEPWELSWEGHLHILHIRLRKLCNSDKAVGAQLGLPALESYLERMQTQQTRLDNRLVKSENRDSRAKGMHTYSDLSLGNRFRAQREAIAFFYQYGKEQLFRLNPKRSASYNETTSIPVVQTALCGSLMVLYRATTIANEMGVPIPPHLTLKHVWERKAPISGTSDAVSKAADVASRTPPAPPPPEARTLKEEVSSLASNIMSSLIRQRNRDSSLEQLRLLRQEQASGSVGQAATPRLTASQRQAADVPSPTQPAMRDIIGKIPLSASLKQGVKIPSSQTRHQRLKRAASDIISVLELTVEDCQMYKDMYDAYRKFEDERFSVYRSRLAAAAGGAAAAADEALAAAELQSGPNDDVINRGESNANLAPATGQIWARMLDAFLGNDHREAASSSPQPQQPKQEAQPTASSLEESDRVFCLPPEGLPKSMVLTDMDEGKRRKVLTQWRPQKGGDRPGTSGRIYFPTRQNEQQLYTFGFRRIVGIDDSGAGSVVGPIVAAACMMPLAVDIPGIRDSKQLSVGERERVYNTLTSHPQVIWSTHVVPTALVNQLEDSLGLEAVNKVAMTGAFRNIGAASPDYVLVDGDTLPKGLKSFGGTAIPQGDSSDYVIAAASIIATVTRSRWMLALAKKYPAYQFDLNFGHLTSDHKKALMRFGPTPMHRLRYQLSREELAQKFGRG